MPVTWPKAPAPQDPVRRHNMQAAVRGSHRRLLELGVVATTVWRMIEPTTLEVGLMGLVAPVVNVLAVPPHMQFCKSDANVRAVWQFSRNDAIGNAAVVAAAVVVAWNGRAWPDLFVV